MDQYLKAYTNVKRVTASPREVEADALTRGAEMLNRCCDAWESDERKLLLKDALKYNQKLWTIFQASVADKANPLPRELKMNIMNLCIFIDNQIFSIIAQPTQEKVRSIINVNLNLAKGLSVKIPYKSEAPDTIA